MAVTVAIPEGDTPTVSFKLSRGRTVHMRQATGMDMLAASRSMGDRSAPAETLYMLICRCIAIDGKPVKIDDFKHLPLGVINKITTEFNKLNDDVPDEDPDKPNPPEPVE